MSENKQYPLSDKKKKELRKKGIVPFSSLVIPAVFLAGVYFLVSKFLFSGDLTAEIFRPVTENYFEKDIYELLSLIKSYLLTLSLYSIALLFTSLVLGLLQTSFLFLPIGRYPEGIRLKGRKKSVKTLVAQSIGASTIIVLVGTLFYFALQPELSFANFSNSDDLPSFLLNRFQPLISLTNIIPVLLLSIGVLGYVSSQIGYFSLHKMSRNEILAESEEQKPGKALV